MSKPRRKKLKNGLRIIVVPMKDNPTVTVMAAVETGSHYESKEQNGLSHFLEHMFFKGTTNRPAPAIVAHELDVMGAQSNAFTGEEYTAYYAKTRAKNFSKALDVIADMFLHSTLPEEELEKERGVIIEEINMYEDLPARTVETVLDAVMYGDQPAGRDILGPKKNIKHFSRDDFLAYREKHYVAKKTVVIVSGNVNPTEAIRDIERAFQGVAEKSRVKKAVVIERQRSPQAKVQYKKSDQAHFMLGFRSFPRGDRRVAPARLLGVILGSGFSSRLFQKLRGEMGVCYYVRARSTHSSDHGRFVIASGVDTKRVHEVVGVVLQEVRRLRKEVVSEQELKKAQEYLIGNMLMGLEASDDLGWFYGNQEILRQKLKTPQDIVRELKAVTPQQIQDVVKEIFQNKKMNLALIGPYRDKRSFEKILKL